MAIDEQVALQQIHDRFHLPGLPGEVLIGRLYGGFSCAEDKDRRHVLFNTGQFTYLGSNHEIEPRDRAETWREIKKENQGTTGPFVGGGPFCVGHEVTL